VLFKTRIYPILSLKFRWGAILVWGICDVNESEKDQKRRSVRWWGKREKIL